MANGSFYQNGLPISSAETGLGNVTPGAPVPNKASSSFYLNGTVYQTLENQDALLALLLADTNLVAADLVAANIAAANSAASAAAAAATFSSVMLKANNLSDVASASQSRQNIGLGNVDNTSDVNKPVSTAQASADALVASNAATANALKANIASPGLTGTPTAPTAAISTNNTQIATTEFVLANAVNNLETVSTDVNTLVSGGFFFIEVTCTNQPVAGVQYYMLVQKYPQSGGYVQQTAWDLTNSGGMWRRSSLAGSWSAWVRLADTASPALTGVPTAPTASPGTNTTQVASTAFATAADAVVTTAYTAADALKAPLASPALTGTPTAPTATVGTNTTQLATTAFVLANSVASGVSSFNTRTGAVVPQADDYAALSGLALNNLGFTVSASAGALTINLTDATGATPSATSPVAIAFRSATPSAGTTSVLKVAAANAVVIPSTSTLGTTSAVACRLWIIGWNDAGTFRLGVFNASNASQIFPLAEDGVASSLQVVAAGNSAGQHYTSGAAVTSKAFRILGYVDWNSSGVATAGTWTTTNLNSIVVFGPGVHKPGERVQIAASFDATNASGTTLIPYDNTAPQNTEGVQFLTKAITPTNAANRLVISSVGNYYYSVVCAFVQALFQDTNVNALATGHNFFAVAGAILQVLTNFEMVAQTTATTTFKIRAGGNTAGTVGFNGAPAAELNGTLSSFLKIEELMG